MTDDRVAELVRRAHEGEILGEALFAELVAGEDDADRRRKLDACRLLEAQTRAHVEVLAADLGVELGPTDEHAALGRSAAGNLAAMPWAECMQAIAGGTAGYRSLYADLLETAGDSGHPVLAELVRHEDALNAFTSAESAGHPDALDGLLGTLDDEHRALAS